LAGPVLKQRAGRGVLASDTPKSPVRLKVTRDSAEVLFPALSKALWERAHAKAPAVPDRGQILAERERFELSTQVLAHVLP
jgi:hypothetical protein